MTKITRLALFCLLTLSLALCGCSGLLSDQDSSLRTQVAQHEQILQQLSVVQPVQADTWSQVQSMRQEVNSLRGEIDALNHAFNQTGGTQNLADTVARLDRALRLIEAQLSMDLLLNTPAIAQPNYAATIPVSSTQSVSQMSSPGTSTGYPSTTGYSPTGIGQSSQPEMSQSIYDSGLVAFNNRRYEAALSYFANFTNSYPNDNNTANAYWWQGESHFQLGNYAAAALAYENVIANFPNSDKAPGAYLKQGMCFLNLNRREAAKERFSQLIEKYPRATEASRAQQEINNNRL